MIDAERKKQPALWKRGHCVLWILMGFSLFYCAEAGPEKVVEAQAEEVTQPHPDPVFFLYEEKGMQLDSPLLGIYENGLIIYSSSAAHPRYRYRSGTLGKQEMNKLLAGLDLESLAKMDQMLIEDDCPHERITMVFWLDGQKQKVTIHGSVKDAVSDQEALKPQFLISYTQLKTLKPVPSQGWLPQRALVFMAPMQASEEPTIPWPDDWPRFEDPRTTQRDGLSILQFDGKSYDTLLSHVAESGKPGQLYQVGDQNWRCVFFYAALPGETLPI